MIYHWFGIINSYNTFCSLLDALWGIPRIIDVFCRETSKYRQVTSLKKKENNILNIKLFKLFDSLSNVYKLLQPLDCELPDIISIWVSSSAKTHWTVAVKKLLKEGTTG